MVSLLHPHSQVTTGKCGGQAVLSGTTLPQPALAQGGCVDALPLVSGTGRPYLGTSGSLTEGGMQRLLLDKLVLLRLQVCRFLSEMGFVSARVWTGEWKPPRVSQTGKSDELIA